MSDDPSRTDGVAALRRRSAAPVSERTGKTASSSSARSRPIQTAPESNNARRESASAGPARERPRSFADFGAADARSKDLLVRDRHHKATANEHAGLEHRKQQDSALDLNLLYSDEPTKYLEEHIFPVLLPGIERLLKIVKRKDEHDEVIVSPTHWLAEYLIANIPKTAMMAEEQEAAEATVAEKSE
ncbi:hypothetical protein HK405_012460 [Cladochytrium tenue]|nr:hypothetical protein HK405_012460 [Cladochytrium tenue]